MKRSDLVTRARNIQQTRRNGSAPDPERAELAIAWAKGEITYTQVTGALGISPGTAVYVAMAHGLKDAVRLGMLK